MGRKVRKRTPSEDSSEDSDQPAHSRSLIRIFTGRILDSKGCCFFLRTIFTKTFPYNFDPLKPHFYIVNWGLQGYTLLFSFLFKNIECGYSLELPRRGGSNETHYLCFEQKYEKYQFFLSEMFQFLEVKFSIYLNRRVFIMNHFAKTAGMHSLICVFVGRTCHKLRFLTLRLK